MVTSIPLKADETGKKQLSTIILQCFDSLKLYGKEPEQIGNLNAMFQFVLADYSYDKIMEAFRFYLSTSSELPTPADIVGIIKRGNKPPLEKSVYTALSKKKDYARSNAEDRYMREYEDFYINGETP